MKLLKEVIEEIKPQKYVLKKCNAVKEKINSKIKNKKIKADAVLGGSIAKGTFLKDDYDCDIFVKFDMSYKNKDISNILEKVLKIFSKVERIHGSRDYFNFKVNGINFEIIPVLDIKKAEYALNITDCSPLHAEWVNKKIKKNIKLADEIRLAKAFFKSANVYGAESYVKGFSGHVIDILVIYYKGFLPLIKNAVKWKENEVIDFNNYYKGKAMKELNKSKISPLIVIDPIQPERNAAAVLSKEKFLLLKQRAEDFLKNPSKSFFRKKEITVEELKKKSKGKKLLILKVSACRGKQDVVGSKILKVFDYISKKLTSNDFKVYEKGWKWDKKKNALFWFIVKDEVLSENFVRAGPPLKSKKNVEDFKKKHRETFVKGSRIYATEKRSFRMPENLINALKKDMYIKEKVRKIKTFI
ncbi:MAG: CCA tRNA nucleotidyltransferase [Candidatus Nanoarchaeia archaeon]|nr:CCA tRNA nucleotidyltransferase [Candidatus Nanoarchaeia archaeon]